MKCDLPTFAIVLSLFAPSLSASEWTTADGRVSVAVPQPERFAQAEPTPPFAVIWVSHDGSVRLGVLTMTIPKGVKLVKASLEEGLVQEVNGELIDSSVDNLSGHQVYRMTARGKASEDALYVSQAVVGVEGTAYKAMAISTGSEPGADTDITRFLTSFRILIPAEQNARNPTPQNSTGSELDTHELSKTLGGIGLLTLIVAILVLWVRRRQSTRSASTSDRDRHR